MIEQLRGLLSSLEIQPITIVDVGLTALLIYGAFSLIRGTRAVRLVIGWISRLDNSPRSCSIIVGRL